MPVDVPERAGAEVEHRQLWHGDDAQQHPERGAVRDDGGGRGCTRWPRPAFAVRQREQLRHVLDGAITLGHLRVWGCGLRSLQEP
jgi:hypothetical protein